MTDAARESFTHDEEAHEFVYQQGTERSFLTYHEIGPGVRDYASTFVPPALRRHGVGTRLVRYALDHARDNGYKIRPSCWFVAEFLERNPDYRELVAG